MPLSPTNKFKLYILSTVLLSCLLVENSVVAQAKPIDDETNNSIKQSPPSPKNPVFSGQKVRKEAIVPMGNREMITDIIVRFLDENGKLTTGKTKPQIITQEFKLQPGDTYSPESAKQDLQGVLDLVIVDRASLYLEKVGKNKEAIIAIAVQENSNLSILNKQDNRRNPTRGYKFKFGSDQYLPIGETDVLANRLAANYTHYLPVPLFGLTKGAKTLVLNLQGGTILGDAVPYESFILGGSSSVRGYGASEISTARSFVQASMEYRYPILGVAVFKNQIDVGGTFFVDYGSDLGSSDAVIGQPAVVRNRPRNGLGYGLGLRALTPIGAVRMEFARNDEADTKFIFKIGDRF